MGNLNQAPKLIHMGEKELVIDGKREGFIGIPNSLFRFICNELGDSSLRLRLMFLLIGTSPGWGVSNKWIEDTIGVQKSSYNSARKYLAEEKKWLKIEEGQLIVDFDKIREDMEKDKKQGIDEISPKNRVQMVLPQNRVQTAYTQKLGTDEIYPKQGIDETTSILLEDDFTENWGNVVIPQNLTSKDF